MFGGHVQLTRHGVRSGFSSDAPLSFWFVFGAVELDGVFPGGPTGAVQFFSARELATMVSAFRAISRSIWSGNKGSAFSG